MYNDNKICSERLFMGSKRLSGFSLIEILIVIAVLIILASLFVKVSQSAYQKASALECMAHLKKLHNAVTLYMNEQWSENIRYNFVPSKIDSSFVSGYMGLSVGDVQCSEIDDDSIIGYKLNENLIDSNKIKGGVETLGGHKILIYEVDSNLSSSASGSIVLRHQGKSYAATVFGDIMELTSSDKADYDF